MREPLSILLVDDSILHRCMLRILLQDWGYTTKEAADGGKAVHMCRELPFDLVVMDMHMPIKTGLEALKEIKIHNPDLPVLIMTACPDNKISIAAAKLGAYGYMPKPIDIDSLKKVLWNVLPHAEMAQGKSQ